MISHYFSYFSASAVRIFWHVAQWKGSKSTSKLCKSIFQNILAYGKSDILDSKMTCASGSPLRKISTTTTKISPPPIDEKLKGIPSLKKILSKKIGKIIKKLYLKLKKLLKKKAQKIIFFAYGELSCVSASPSIPHNMVPPSKGSTSTKLSLFSKVSLIWGCLPGLGGAYLEKSSPPVTT